MALAAFANFAAATSAGYTEVVTDRGASFSPATLRFEVLLTKAMTGEPGFEGVTRIRAFGQGASQVAAEAVALAALNNQRGHRYGFDTGTASKGPRGGQHVIDAT